MTMTQATIILTITIIKHEHQECSNKFEAPLAKRDVFTDTAFRHLSRDRFRDNSSFSTGS